MLEETRDQKRDVHVKSCDAGVLEKAVVLVVDSESRVPKFLGMIHCCHYCTPSVHAVARRFVPHDLFQNLRHT